MIAGSGALVLAAVSWEHWRDRRRSAALTKWASSLGFTIVPEQVAPDAASAIAGLVRLPVFQRGRDARIRNIMDGSAAEGRVVVLDHEYVTGSGKNKSTITQTLVAVELAGEPLPAFVLGPEGLFARLGQVFGTQDIDFEESPQFSRAYQLKASDAEAIRRVFERNAVPFLAEHPGWSVEANGRWIAAYRQGRREKVKRMSAYLEDALTVIRVIITGGR